MPGNDEKRIFSITLNALLGLVIGLTASEINEELGYFNNYNKNNPNTQEGMLI